MGRFCLFGVFVGVCYLLSGVMKCSGGGKIEWLRLADGVSEGHGRAELKIDGKWGTICDRWSRRGKIDEKGWPTLFCRNLGYTRAARAGVTRASSNRATGPISAKSPVCDQNAQLMTDCNLLGHYCWHAQDVYINCVNY